MRIFVRETKEMENKQNNGTQFERKTRKSVLHTTFGCFNILRFLCSEKKTNKQFGKNGTRLTQSSSETNLRKRAVKPQKQNSDLRNKKAARCSETRKQQQSGTYAIEKNLTKERLHKES